MKSSYIIIAAVLIFFNVLNISAKEIKKINLQSMFEFVLSNDIEIKNLIQKKNKLLQKLNLKKREFYPSVNFDISKSISDNDYYEREIKNLSLNYKLYDSKKRKTEKMYILSEIELCALELESKKRELYYNICNAYYGIILIDRKIDLVEKNINEAEKTLSDMKIKVQLKKLLNIDMLQQQDYLKELELRKIILQNSRKKNIEILLQKLTGYSNSKQIDFDFRLMTDYDYQDLDFEKIYESALTHNYDYQSVIYIVDQNRLNEIIMSSSNKPNIILSGGFSDDDYLNSDYNDKKEWFFKGTVSYNFDTFKIPLLSNTFSIDNHNFDTFSDNDYTGYSLSLGINNSFTSLHSRIDNDNNRLLYEKRKLNLEHSLYNDLLDKFLYNKELKKSYELQISKIKTQKEIVRKYEIMYEVGKILMNDFIEQKQKLLNEQIELFDITIKNIMNLNYINKLSGL